MSQGGRCSIEVRSIDLEFDFCIFFVPKVLLPIFKVLLLCSECCSRHGMAQIGNIFFALLVLSTLGTQLKEEECQNDVCELKTLKRGAFVTLATKRIYLEGVLAWMEGLKKVPKAE